MSMSFLKEIFYSIKIPLLKIINQSLASGIFPNSFKKALVIPIHKQGDSHTFTNYRPNSLL